MNRVCRSLEATSAGSAKRRQARASCAHTKTALGVQRLRRTLEGRKRLQRPVLLADALSTSRWKRHAGPSRSRARRLRTWRRPTRLGWRRCSSPWPGSASCRLGASARGLVIGLAPATLPTTRVAAVSTRIACRGERRSEQAPGLIWWQSSERRGAEACGGGEGSSPASS